MLVKELGRLKRHGRIRKKMFGTEERPRLAVHRSLKNIYAQAINDEKSVTLCAGSTRDENVAKGGAKVNKTQAAQKLGEFLGKELKKKGIAKIAFDRGGFAYHGRIKALAESLRQAGIEF